LISWDHGPHKLVGLTWVDQRSLWDLLLALGNSVI